VKDVRHTFCVLFSEYTVKQTVCRAPGSIAESKRRAARKKITESIESAAPTLPFAIHLAIRSGLI
jgi:hypothetical protein